MSRIGNKIIVLPEKVTVEINGGFAVIKGPKGELKFKLPIEIKLSQEGSKVKIEPAKDSTSIKTRSLWGTTRSLIANMVYGVSEGFERKLEIEGIGYKAQIQGKDLMLNLGFSHPVEFKAPEGIAFKVEKNVISISGIDKFLVGEVAANIRKLKKPEPYKGKGIRYQGEIVRRKAGKKSVASA